MQPLTQTRIFSPMIAVGSDEASGTGGGKVKVYEYSEMARRWQVKIHLEWPWNVDEAKQQKETSALSSYVHIVRLELWTSSEELSWNFAFELVGRDFLNLDRPCSRHCLCPKHRPLLSCSRHCEQVNAVIILSFANFEECVLNRDLRIITLRPLGGEREVAAGTPTKFDIKQVRGNWVRWARCSDTFVDFVQNQKLFMDLFRLASLRIMVVQCGGWVLTIYSHGCSVARTSKWSPQMETTLYLGMLERDRNYTCQLRGWWLCETLEGIHSCSFLHTQSFLFGLLVIRNWNLFRQTTWTPGSAFQP